MRFPGSVLAVAASAALAPAACAPRYRWANELDAPGRCAGYERPRSVGERLGAGAPGDTAAVRGRVEQFDGGAPVAHATVVLRPAAGGRAVGVEADTGGAFAVPRVPPGAYALEVRRIGVAMLRDTLTVAPGPVVRLRARMARDALDGPCSGFAMVRVRKPWWHLW